MFNLVATVNSEKILLEFAAFAKRQNTNSADVLFGTKELSRYGTWEVSDASEFCKKSKDLGLNPVLVWDVLQTEDRMIKNIELFKRLPLESFKSIRVQDPGVLEFIKNDYPWMKIELILETGNHNLEGLKKWIEYGDENLDKVILSLELPKEKLSTIVPELKKLRTNLKVELMYFGPILLFYTPRNLLSSLNENTTSDFIFATGKSEESPHSGFPLIENRHGTFMLNTKDHALLGEEKNLHEIGITSIRFDQDILNKDKQSIFDESVFPVTLFSTSEKEIETLKKNNPRALIKGFFSINKSDVLFTKLKNRKIERIDESYIGEIIDVERDKGLCVWVKATEAKKLPIDVRIITPEGKEKFVSLNQVHKMSGEISDTLATSELFILPFVGGITVKSKVYFK